MPFGDWKDFDDCVRSMMEKQGYDEETAKKICGKLKAELESPGDVAKAADELWTMDLTVLEGSGRRFGGVASIPEADRENEVVLKSAIEEALQFFMALPVVHFYHTEKPLGLIDKAWFEGEDFRVEGFVKETPDCDAEWAAMQKGELNQLSIFGKRRSGSPECRLPPRQRTSPCVTKALWLYSISVCPTGTAVNRRTFAEVLKSIVQKATTTASALIHPTVDGPETKMPDEMQNGGEQPKTPTVEELLAQVLEKLSALEAKLPGVEKAEDGESPEKEEEKAVQKAEDIQKAETRFTALEDLVKGQAEQLKALGTKLEEKSAELETLKKAVPKRPVYVVQGEAGAPKSPGAANIRALESM